MNLGFDSDTWVRTLTMLPIVVCSIVGSALTAAKWLQFRRAQAAVERLLPQVRVLAGSGEYASALAVARADPSPAARLVERALANAGRSRDRLVEGLHEAGRDLAHELDYGLGGLSLLATLGPLLGLFGTVVGIVLVFERLAASGGVVSATQLAGGIGTALYTTVGGLLVGMLALVSHRALQARCDVAIAQLERTGRELVDIMTGADT